MNNILLLGLGVILLIVGLHLVAGVGGYLLIKRRPSNPTPTPDEYGLAYEKVTFPSHYKAQLEGWWMPATSPKGTLILCHGQNGGMEADLPQAISLVQGGYNVLMFNFRAHGGSGGKYVTFGVFEKEDLLGAIDFLRTQKGVDKVGVIGFSMGAGVALIAATLTDKISVLVLDGIFLQFRQVVKRAFRERFFPPFHLILAELSLLGATIITNTRLYQVSPWLWARHLATDIPVLFVHAEKDQYTTLSEVQALANDLYSPHQIWLGQGSRHRQAFSDHTADYNAAVLAWLEKHYRAH